jgi:hypothetical protein
VNVLPSQTERSEPAALLLAQSPFLALQLDPEDAIAAHRGDVRIAGVAGDRGPLAAARSPRPEVAEPPAEHAECFANGPLKLGLGHAALRKASSASPSTSSAAKLWTSIIDAIGANVPRPF